MPRSTAAVLAVLVVVATACSSDPPPRSLGEPSVEEAVSEPDLARTAGTPSEPAPLDVPDPGEATVLDGGASTVIHVLGSIRTPPEGTPSWAEEMPLVFDDMATIASLSCDQNASCQPDRIAAWTSGQVDAINLATSANVLDATGLADVQDALTSEGVATLGFGADVTEATAPLIFENAEASIAIHAISLAAAGEVTASEASAGIAGPRVFDSVLRSIESSREAGHGVVVIVDWGNLEARAPGDAQLAAVDQLIDFGADAIIGHGSDFLQRFDQVGSAAVAYGLGNVVSETEEPLRRDTAVLRLEFGAPGRSCLIPATATPDGPIQDDISVTGCSG